MVRLLRSLSFRLILLVMVALLPALGAIVYNAMRDRQEAMAAAHDQLRRLVALVAREQAQKTMAARQFLMSLALQPAVGRHDAAACNAIFNLLESHPSIYINVGAVDPEGNVFASALPMSGPVNAADKHWFQAASRTRDFALGKLMIGRIARKPVTVYGYPVLDKAGEVQAVLFASISMGWLNDLASEAGLPEDSVLAIIDAAGTIVAKYPKPEKWAGKSLPPEGLIFIIRKDGQGIAEAQGMDGLPRLYAFMPLERDAQLGFVYAGIPTRAVYAAADQTLRRNLAVLGGVLLLALGFAWGFGRLLIMRRINPLVQTTARLAAGDLAARTGLTTGPDELGQLAQAFDQMAASLEAREAERRQAEAEIKGDEARAASLLRISHYPAASIRELLDYVLSEAITLTGSTIGYLYQYDEAAQQFTLMSYSKQVMLECSVPPKDAYRLEKAGIWGEAVRQRRPIIVNDFQASHPLKKGYPEGHAELYNFLTIPVFIDQRIVGVVGVGNKSTDYDESDVLQLTLMMESVWQIADRRRTEAALRESEARFQALFEQAAVGAAQIDTASGRFVRINRKFCDIVGYTREEMERLDFQSITHPDDLAADLGNMERLKAGEIGEFTREKRYFRQDGAIVWVSLTVSPMWSPGAPPDYHIAVVQDITDRKEAEAALRQSEEKFRLVFEKAPIGIVHYDLTGTITDSNARFEEITGAPKEQFVGFNLIRQLRDEQMREAVAASLHGEVGYYQGDYLTVTANKLTPMRAIYQPIFSPDGAMSGGIGIVEDITERQRAEAALRQSEENFRALYNRTPVMLHSIDPEGMIVSVSDYWLETMGYAREEVLGRHSVDFLTAQSRREALEVNLPRFMQTGYARDVEYRFVKKSGEIMDVLLSAVMEKDAAGAMVRTLGVVVDITSRKQAEAALRQSEALLREAQRVAHIGSWSVNLQDNTIKWSDETYRIYGVTKEEFPHTPESFMKLLHPDDRPLMERWIEQTIAQLKPAALDFRVVLPDGTVHYIRGEGDLITDQAGNPERLTGTAQDITARKLAEAERDRLFNLSIDMLCIAGLDGFFKQLNPAWSKTLGWTDQELMRRPWLELVHPEDRAATIAAGEQLAAGEAVYGFENRYLCRDGSYRWISWNSFPLLEEDLIFCVARDVTERQQAEEALRQSEERLRLKLDSILSPDVDIVDQDLSNILDLPAVQSLMEDLTKLTNMAVAILDLQGNVLVATGWQDICTQYHRVHPQTAQACTASDLFLAKNLRPGEYVANKCKNHLWDVATPLFIGGKHVGNIYTGQFFYADEAVDEQIFIDQAAKYGFDQEAYLSALQRVPRISREQVKTLMDFLVQFSELVSKLSYSNLNLAKAMFEQQRAEEEILRFASFPRLNPNPVLEVDLDGKVTYGNESAYEALRKLGRQDITAFLPPDLEDLIQSYQEKGVKRFFREVKIDGAVFAATIHIAEEFKTLRLFAIDITARKQAEAERDRLFNHSLDILCVGGFDGFFKQVNPAGEKLLGWTDQELLKKPWIEFVHPEDRAATIAAGEQLAAGEAVYAFENRYQCRDGSYRWFSWNAFPLLEESLIFCLARDVTARQQAEAALRESEERFRGFIENASDLVYALTPEGILTYVSPNFLDLMGEPAAEALGKSFEPYVHPDDLHLCREFLERVLTTGEPLVSLDYRALHRDGSIRWHSTKGSVLRDRAGNVVGYMGISRDITERKQAEEALRQREELYRSLFENMLNGFAYCKMLFEHDQPQDFIYLEVNSSFEALTGLKNVVGKKVSEVIPGIRENDPELLAIYGRVALTGQHERFETYVAALQMWFAVSVYSPAREYFVAVFDVITERKQAEEALKEIGRVKSELLEKLNEAQQVAAIGSWEWNLQTNNVWWSDETYRIFGVTPQDFVPSFEANGKFIHSDDFASYGKSFEHSLQTGEPLDLDIRLVTHDGLLKHANAKGEVIYNDSGRPMRFIGTIMDVTERRQAEEALRESEERLRLALAAANQGLYDLNILTGEAIVSPEYARQLGYEPEEFVETNEKWIERLHPDDREEVAANYQAYVKGEIPAYRVEFRQRTKSGDWKWIFSLGKIVDWDAEGRPLRMLGTHTDISERKQAEEELVKNLDILNEMGAIARIGGWEHNVITGEATWTKALYDIVEFEPGRPPGPGEHLDYYPPEDRAILAAAYQRAGETGEPFDLVLQCYSALHRPFWARVVGRPVFHNGKCISMVGTFQDITELKQAEAALQQRFHDLATLYAASQAFLGQIGVAATSQAICRLAVEHFGLRMAWVGLVHPGDYLVHPAAAFGAEAGYLDDIRITWDDSPTGQGPTGTAIRTRQPFIMNNLETEAAFAPWREAAQARGYRSSAAIPLCTDDEVMGALNLYSDQANYFQPDRLPVLQAFANQLAVALQKARLYEEIQRHAAVLEDRVAERTARLQATNLELDRFAYSVSHDLRAPLRAMQGFSQALLEDYAGELDPGGQGFARRINAAAERMDRLIQDLLAYSRLSREEMALQPVSLEQTVAEALAHLEGDIRDRQARVRVEPPLLEVQAHHVTLLQVVANLVSNAIKFTAPDVQPQVRLRAEDRGGRVRLWVEDNGLGIAPEHQERIFRIFERLHGVEAYPGTGIGLAIVSKGVERMGGQVGVESALGQGSRFWVELAKAI